MVQTRVVPLLWAALCFSVSPAQAQFQPGPGGATQDPLMALMLSQPRIDVDSPVVPVALFDPPAVKPGQEAILRITFNALEASIKLPASLPAQPSTPVQASAHGQLLVLTGTNYQPRTTFNFRLRPDKPGALVVPGFTAEVYGKPVRVPACQLQVAADLPPGFPQAQTLRLELPRTNVYVGEALETSITLPASTSLVLQHASPVQIIGDGFIADPTTLRPRLESRRLGIGNAGFSSTIYELLVTPIASGRLTLSAQAFVGSRSSQAFIITPGNPLPGLPLYNLVDSGPLELQVAPLPKEGQLPGFTGAVGSFLSDPPQLSTNHVRVGEPLKLTVKVRGEGNLVRLVPPPVPQSQQWRVFPGEPSNTHPQITQAQGFTVFNYTLIPLSDRLRQTPAIPFSCFDPLEGKYADCTIQPAPLQVSPGPLPGDLEVIAKADALAGPPEKEPVLSSLASAPGFATSSLAPLQRRPWYPLLQLAPALAFLALWGWDRRRRYFEAHPDALLRRRARRALRPQLRRMQAAATRRQTEPFAAAAVRALEIASAPFYPAEPRALVGADILAILPEPQRSGTEAQAVRKLFDSADAAHFRSRSEGAPGGFPAQGLHAPEQEVLSLAPALQKVLEILDQRLRQ